MAYDSQAYTGTPAFVTTDAAYHTWHLVFDKVLRTRRDQAAVAALDTWSRGCSPRAHPGGRARRHARSRSPRTTWWSCSRSPGRSSSWTWARSARTPRPSSRSSRRTTGSRARRILGTDIDYSLYTPRGHYTKTKALTRYFLAMSVLGQTAFALPGALQSRPQPGGRLWAAYGRARDPDARGPSLAGQAVAVHLRADGVPGRTVRRLHVRSSWRPRSRPRCPARWPIRRPLADDSADRGGGCGADRGPTGAHRPRAPVGPADGHPVRHRLLGDGSAGLARTSAPGRSRGCWRRRSTSPPRSVPTSPYGIQRAAGEAAYVNYETQMAPCARRSPRGRTARGAAPSTTRGSRRSSRCGCRTAPRSRTSCVAGPGPVKDHQSGFGSYAELRHDTILYIKQSMGEMGDAGPERDCPGTGSSPTRCRSRGSRRWPTSRARGWRAASC